MSVVNLWQNLRYAFRVLGKSPAFTTVAVLSLALGIGANTAIFTLINALLLRNLPVRDPRRLVQLVAVRPDGKVPFSYPMFREVERGQRVFTGLIAWGSGGMINVEVNGVLAQNVVMTTTGNCYSELGATPFIGRLLIPEDSDPNRGTTSQVAVISYEFWRNRFGAASDIVGKQIRIEGQPFTIVGVTRRLFRGMTIGLSPDLTIPITAYARLQEGNGFRLDTRSILWLSVIGRLKDGITIEQARAQLQSFWPEVLLATASTDTPGPRRQRFLSMGLEVSSAAKGFRSDLRTQFTRPLYVLAGIVGLILLVACVNLANLMLARAAARTHEMSVRVAIGASRWSVARQVLAECLVLSFAGALLGLTFAFWGSRLLVLLMTQGNLFPLVLDVSPDLRVLVLTMSVSILTAILFGIAPAWRSSREDPASLLQQNARNMTRGAGKLSRALIVTQVALSLVLLLGAGLLARSFEKLLTIDLGFPKESLLEVNLYPKPGGYRNLDRNNYRKQLFERISSLPGVSSVSFGDATIPSPQGWRDTVAPMTADPSTGVRLLANATQVSPGFFQTLRIPLLRGRDFTETDDEHHPRVAIVSSDLAERLFPNGDALGKKIRFGFMPDYENIEVVGISRNARIFDIRDAAAPVIFLPSFKYTAEWGSLVVRTKEAPEDVVKAIRQSVDALGHEYVLRARTVEQVISQELMEERVTTMLSGFFAALALLLASVGLYGLMSYAVTRRTREIGIRMAVGAQRQNILWILLRQGLAVVLLGIAIGIPCALAASKLIGTMLFGLSSTDLPTIGAVSLLLLSVALLAAYLPGRRASVIDPMVALRTE